MPTATFHYATEDERVAIEAAIAYVCELRSLAQTAPAGRVLSMCEQQALEQGRKFLRANLESAVQSRIGQAEQKGAKRVAAAPAPAPSASNAATVPAKR
jgi:hypothetical protein